MLFQVAGKMSEYIEIDGEFWWPYRPKRGKGKGLRLWRKKDEDGPR